MKKNILVFPCGSEIGLELNRSLKYSIHFHLIGGSSVDDHGKFVYEDYINKIPFISSSTFINSIAEIVKKRKIDAIYPTMDEVIVILKKNEDKIGCKIISSCLETVTTCLSKTKSYEKLKEYINVPKIFTEFEDIIYPIFSKPEVQN